MSNSFEQWCESQSIVLADTHKDQQYKLWANQYAAEQVEIVRRNEVDPRTNLLRFVAGAWDDANSWIWKNAAHLDAIGKYPIVQGTNLQLSLRKIGQQEFNNTGVGDLLRELVHGPVKTGKGEDQTNDS